ncbi:MAG: ATP-binding cassette domain-containing protein [Sporocytophaga sp.]|nr:ATP-binding cassette domain-containing protein [Sporocytophaga sp.]
MSISIAELRGVTKKYQVGETEILALNNVYFNVTKGDFIVVAGPSGSGKSTFLNILGSIDKPTSGNIIFNGSDITHVNLEALHQLRLNKIGFVFQSFNLVPVLTAYENVELPLLFKNISKKEIKERVTTVLEKSRTSRQNGSFACKAIRRTEATCCNSQSIGGKSGIDHRRRTNCQP